MASPEQISVLVVDDFAGMRKLAETALSDIGIRKIHLCESAKYARFALQESLKVNQLFDIVLCDFKMPDMTGLEFLKELRANPEFKKLPFIMVTTVQEKSMIVESIRAGVNNYIIKPLHKDILREKMGKVLRIEFP